VASESASVWDGLPQKPIRTDQPAPRLDQYASSPVTGPTVRQNSVSCLAVAETIPSTHCALPTEGWPGWVGLGGLVKFWDDIL